jgi:hypothetical protein
MRLPVGGSVHGCYFPAGAGRSEAAGPDPEVWGTPSNSGNTDAGPRVAARTSATKDGTRMAMSRSSSWKEHRLADRLECGEATYSVDLVARKATGVEGWKMTLVFLPRESGSEIKVELPNAASTAEVRRTVRELEGQDARLRELCESATG